MIIRKKPKFSLSSNNTKRYFVAPIAQLSYYRLRVGAKAIISSKSKVPILVLQKSQLDLLGESLLWIRVRKHFLVTRDQRVVTETNNPSLEAFKKVAGAD